MVTETNNLLAEYHDFLKRKVALSESKGIAIDPSEVNSILKPHQRDAVCWAVGLGRAALFESFGLGKTFQQLEIVRIVLQKTGGKGLIILPLGVRQEFKRDAETLGIKVTFVRSDAEILWDGIYLTNYESVREGKINPQQFKVISLDEAGILRGFGGTKTFREFMATIAGDDRRDRSNPLQTEGVPYRFVATATPSPNEYIELLAYAAFLGVMDVGQAKTRFFRRDSEHADHLTLHEHKKREFWLWVASWAIFLQKPSDLCWRKTCQKEKNSKTNDSDISSLKNGFQENSVMEHGSANAIAEKRNSQDQVTLLEESSSVVGAYDQNMAEHIQGFTISGNQCSIDADVKTARTGKNTEAEGLQSVKDGLNSQTSKKIWETQNQENPSTESITMEITSQVTADGQQKKNRHETAVSGLNIQTGRETTKASSCSQCPNHCPLDEGYELPPLDVRWHEIPTDHSKAGTDRNGQVRMLANASLGVVEASREKKNSLEGRIKKLLELKSEDSDAHMVIWHDLEAERYAIENSLPDAVTIYGSQDLDKREQAIIDFADGKTQVVACKPVMLGSGVNFQKHCHRAIYLSIGYKFNDFIQSVHRLHRFLQTQPVRIDLIYTEAEREVRASLEKKWKQHTELVEQMTNIIHEYGLSQAAIAGAMKRSIGVERQEESGQNWKLINNDCVEETYCMPENSVDLILTSIPFATQYEYSPSYNDFGHTDNVPHFFSQMDFLSPQLLRVLKPGRNLVIHVKDRIIPGGLTGLGFQVVQPFHADCIYHYQKHGFAYLGMKTIVTDVVRENNQTYRLGWTEQCKDGTRMGVGMPEYLLIFRKPPTDSSKGYADEPVVKNKEEYSRARWQLDAHGFERSSGNRLLTSEDLKGIPHDQIFKLFRKYSLTEVYDYEKHVQIGETLESDHMLPSGFMLLPPQSWSEEVWTDVARMRSLNGRQYAKGRDLHICPLPLDIVERVIVQMSNPGETVLDPFSGIATVPYVAVKEGRKGIGIELSTNYYLDGIFYCKEAEQKLKTPTLFDLLDEDGNHAKKQTDNKV